MVSLMEVDRTRYKVYTWKHWMVLHWIINPGLAVCEILFGMRVTGLMLLDRLSDKPAMDFSVCMQ